MKIRCTTDSVRLRLRKSDMDTLREQGRVAEKVRFAGGQSFGFELSIGPVGMPEAVMEPFGIRVVLPEDRAGQWIHSDEVGIEQWSPLPDGGKLHLLIEKDFPCKDRADEDKSDTFQELAARQENGDHC